MLKFIVTLLLVANVACAENYQYIMTGSGNGKKVTGYLTGYENGTVAGNVDGKFVSGDWTGVGICQVSDGENFYEMEVFDE